MLPSSCSFRIILLILFVGRTWAQDSEEAQKKAKLEAERRQLGSSPRSQTGAPKDPSTAYAQKRAAEAMHSAVLTLGGNGPVVKDKPYRALAVTETLRPLLDGNRIVRKNSTQHYRDRLGRTRREQTIETLGASMPITPVRLIVISDPVAGMDYIVDDARMTVRKFARYESDAPNQKPEPGSNTISLGTRTVEGVECTGTKTTVTIPAGQIGNTLPIEIVTESWYSPAIQALVRSTTSDPRFGQTSYTLRNIVLEEPPRSLFEPPAGYKLEFEGRPGVMMNRPNRH